MVSTRLHHHLGVCHAKSGRSDAESIIAERLRYSTVVVTRFVRVSRTVLIGQRKFVDIPRGRRTLLDSGACSL